MKKMQEDSIEFVEVVTVWAIEKAGERRTHTEREREKKRESILVILLFLN